MHVYAVWICSGHQIVDEVSTDNQVRLPLVLGDIHIFFNLGDTHIKLVS